MARYTADQLRQIQSPEALWQQQGWVDAGWQTDDGQQMWTNDDGERRASYSQMLEMRENGDFGSPASLLPSDVIRWNLNDTSTPAWFNQNYGTNFGGMEDYLNYLYGPGGEVVRRGAVTGQYDPQLDDTDYYVLPQGKTQGDYVNAPLSYYAPDSTGLKITKALVGGLALGGLGGFLPGTESIFGAAAGGAGAAAEGGLALGSQPWWSSMPAFGDPLTAAGVAGGATSTGGSLASLGGAGMGLTGGSGLGAIPTIAGGAAGGSAALGLGGLPTQYGSTIGTLGTAANPGIGAATTAQSGAALSRFLAGNATDADKLQLLGGLGSTALGISGANAQADAYSEIADKYLNLGAPYRQKLEASYAPGFSMADQPDFMNALDLGAQAAARATSAKVGNPVDNPGAYSEMQKYISGSLALPQLNTYRSQLGSFGQLGTNTAGTNDTAAAGQTGGMYNAAGYGLGQLTQPKNPYEDAMKGLLGQFKLNQGYSF